MNVCIPRQIYFSFKFKKLFHITIPRLHMIHLGKLILYINKNYIIIYSFAEKDSLSRKKLTNTLHHHTVHNLYTTHCLGIPYTSTVAMNSKQADCRMPSMAWMHSYISFNWTYYCIVKCWVESQLRADSHTVMNKAKNIAAATQLLATSILTWIPEKSLKKSHYTDLGQLDTT